MDAALLLCLRPCHVKLRLGGHRPQAVHLAPDPASSRHKQAQAALSPPPPLSQEWSATRAWVTARPSARRRSPSCSSTPAECSTTSTQRRSLRAAAACPTPSSGAQVRRAGGRGRAEHPAAEHGLRWVRCVCCGWRLLCLLPASRRCCQLLVRPWHPIHTLHADSLRPPPPRPLQAW